MQDRIESIKDDIQGVIDSLEYGDITRDQVTDKLGVAIAELSGLQEELKEEEA